MREPLGYNFLLQGLFLHLERCLFLPSVLLCSPLPCSLISNGLPFQGPPIFCKSSGGPCRQDPLPKPTPLLRASDLTDLGSLGLGTGSRGRVPVSALQGGSRVWPRWSGRMQGGCRPSVWLHLADAAACRRTRRHQTPCGRHSRAQALGSESWAPEPAPCPSALVLSISRPDLTG